MRFAVALVVLPNVLAMWVRKSTTSLYAPPRWTFVMFMTFAITIQYTPRFGLVKENLGKYWIAACQGRGKLRA